MSACMHGIVGAISKASATSADMSAHAASASFDQVCGITHYMQTLYRLMISSEAIRQEC